MCCSTCDGYEFVPGPDSMLEDCPDCRAIDRRPLRWCPVHFSRVEVDGGCLKCRVEALRATTAIQARTAARAVAA
jgi:hypothetical protein